MKKIVTLLLLLFIIIPLSKGQMISWVKSGAGNEYLSVNNEVDMGYSVVSDDNFIYLSGVLTGDYAYIDGTYFDETYFEYNNFQFLSKFDKNGNLVWLRELPGMGKTKTVIDNEGYIYTVGRNFNSSHGFIVKYDSNGNLLTEKELISNAAYSRAYSVAISSDNDVLISGYFSASVGEDIVIEDTTLQNLTSYKHAFVIKYDNTGGFSWINISDGGDFCVFSEVEVDSNDNLILCGYFQPFKDYNITIGDTSFYSVIHLSDDYPSQDILTVKYTSNGDFLWVKTMGGHQDDWGNDLTLDISDNIYITGTFIDSARFENINVTSRGSYDIYLCKLSSVGRIDWVKTIGGQYGYIYGVGYEAGRSIFSDNNDIYVSGSFIIRATFGEGDNEIEVASSYGQKSGFIAKYSNTGEYKWVKYINSYKSTIRNIFVKESDLYSAGNFFPNADMSNYTFNYQFPQTTNFFLLSIDLSLTGVANIDNNNIQLYPNPTSGRIYFKNKDKFINYPFKIYITDVNGNILISEIINSEDEIDISKLKSGIYFLKFSDGTNTYFQKIIKVN